MTRHLLGVAGLVLMLWAGFAYSARKRRVRARGSMEGAMLAHIVAGLAGPALVMMHAGQDLGGMAGIATAAMLVVVASGIVGRAVYTATPRAVAVSDPVRAAMLDAELARMEVEAADAARAGGEDEAAHQARRARMVALRHEQEHLRAHWEHAAAPALWRRVFAGWWYLHVPAAMALWVLIAAHVAAALGYSSGR